MAMMAMTTHNSISVNARLLTAVDAVSRDRVTNREVCIR
jgi:hypothetical protein